MFHQHFATFFIKMLTNIFSKCSNIFRKNQQFFWLSSTSGSPVEAAAGGGGAAVSATHGGAAGPGELARAARPMAAHVAQAISRTAASSRGGGSRR
jgi:hypothetical protein